MFINLQLWPAILIKELDEIAHMSIYLRHGVSKFHTQRVCIFALECPSSLLQYIRGGKRGILVSSHELWKQRLGIATAGRALLEGQRVDDRRKVEGVLTR